MQTREKYKEWLKQARDIFSGNIRKNILTFFITLYFILLALLNASVLLFEGDINNRVFWTIVLDGITPPIMIVLSLVMTGKYKNLEKIVDVDRKLALMEIEVALKKQEIEFLKKDLNNTNKIRDLRKELVFERELSEHKLRALALRCNVSWGEANKQIREFEQDVKDAVKTREAVGNEIQVEEDKN